MMRNKAKAAIIIFSLSILFVIGYLGWNYIESMDYTTNNLKGKYPSFADFKNAVDSGEINYDRLPDEVKEMLKNYNTLEEIHILPEIKIP